MKRDRLRIAIVAVCAFGLVSGGTGRRVHALPLSRQMSQLPSQLPPLVEPIRPSVGPSSEGNGSQPPRPLTDADVRLGAAVRQYRERVAQTGRQDPPALAALALQSAATLTGAANVEIAAGACGVVLGAEPRDSQCQRVMTAINTQETSLDGQGLAVYALANAGVRPWPTLFSTFEGQLSSAARLQIVGQMTRLPADERVRILAPIFDDPDSVTSRPKAAVLLGDIEGPDAMNLLYRLAGLPFDPATETMIRAVLARRGDPTALAAADQLRLSMTGPAGVEAALALAVAQSPWGPSPEGLLETTRTEDRPHVALALAPIVPDAAKASLRSLMGDPNAATREKALRAGGTLGMGFDDDVYYHVIDAAPGARLAAINAILQTATSPR